MRLGERESGTARLQEAVEAYQNALLERTRAHVPLDWAMTQNNLGDALVRLGERELGTAQLQEAVKAYQNALLELTHARVPLLSAQSEHNLANVLRLLETRRTQRRAAGTLPRTSGLSSVGRTFVWVPRIVQRLAKAAGVEADFGGHSPRVILEAGH